MCVRVAEIWQATADLIKVSFTADKPQTEETDMDTVWKICALCVLVTYTGKWIGLQYFHAEQKLKLCQCTNFFKFFSKRQKVGLSENWMDPDCSKVQRPEEKQVVENPIQNLWFCIFQTARSRKTHWLWKTMSDIFISNCEMQLSHKSGSSRHQKETCVLQASIAWKTNRPKRKNCLKFYFSCLHKQMGNVKSFGMPHVAPLDTRTCQWAQMLTDSPLFTWCTSILWLNWTSSLSTILSTPTLSRKKNPTNERLSSSLEILAFCLAYLRFTQKTPSN